MISAIQILFSPGPVWEKLALKNRNVFWILFLFLIPLMAVSLFAEGWGLTQWGERRALDMRVKISQDLAIRYTLTQAVLGLAMVLVAARVLQSVAKSFHVNATYTQGLTVAAYGFSPVFLFRILDAVPAINTWICWGVGALFSVMVLYHGVALIFKPDQTKGFGLYLVAIICVVAFSLLGHFAAVNVLHEKLLKDVKILQTDTTSERPPPTLQIPGDSTR